LVDGSLRNATWYLKYFEELRSSFPKLRIAIIDVHAEVDIVLKRARKRSFFTGRIVPEEAILDSIQAISHSLEALVPKVDFYARIDNEDDDDPIVEYCEMKSKDSGEILWSMHMENHEFFLTQSLNQTADKVLNWKDIFRNIWNMQCPI
jgi:hypothetical protein